MATGKQVISNTLNQRTMAEWTKEKLVKIIHMMIKFVIPTKRIDKGIK
jgi:hypothetical protein